GQARRGEWRAPSGFPPQCRPRIGRAPLPLGFAVRFGRLLRRITMRQGDQVGSAWERPVTCSRDGGDISQQLRMPSRRHMPSRQGEWCVDARRAVAALAKKVGESFKWPTLAGEVLNGRETDQPRPFEDRDPDTWPRSEEHTSELQSRENLVCRLPLE